MFRIRLPNPNSTSAWLRSSETLRQLLVWCFSSDLISSIRLATETVLLGFIWFLSVVHSEFHSQIANKEVCFQWKWIKKCIRRKRMVITSAPHKDILMWIVISLTRQWNCYDVREWSKVEKDLTLLWIILTETVLSWRLIAGLDCRKRN